MKSTLVVLCLFVFLLLIFLLSPLFDAFKLLSPLFSDIFLYLFIFIFFFLHCLRVSALLLARSFPPSDYPSSTLRYMHILLVTQSLSGI